LFSFLFGDVQLAPSSSGFLAEKRREFEYKQTKPILSLHCLFKKYIFKQDASLNYLHILHVLFRSICYCQAISELHRSCL